MANALNQLNASLHSQSNRKCANTTTKKTFSYVVTASSFQQRFPVSHWRWLGLHHQQMLHGLIFDRHINWPEGVRTRSPTKKNLHLFLFNVIVTLTTQWCCVNKSSALGKNISEHSQQLGRKGLTSWEPSARWEASGSQCVIHVSLIPGTWLTYFPGDRKETSFTFLA